MVTPFDDALSKCDNEVDRYTDAGSGWKVDSKSSVRVGLHIATYDPIVGSLIFHSPSGLTLRNIINQEDYCFLLYSGSILPKRW